MTISGHYDMDRILKLADQFMKLAMLVDDVSTSVTDATVIAFKDKIFIFNTNILYNTKPSKKELAMLNRMIKHVGLSQYSATNIDRVMEHLESARADVLVGSLNDQKSELFIRDNQLMYSAKSSVLIKKVMDQLGLNKVTSARPSDDGDDVYYDTYKNEVKGAIPDIMYHGTCGKNALGIFKTGLMAGQAGTNYPRAVKHEQDVFLSSDYENALWHSANSANRQKSFPVILQVRIPDKSKLIPDWDVDTSSSQTLWTTNNPLTRLPYHKPEDSMKLSREFGIFGYRGRIPPNFIENVWAKHETLGEGFKQITKEDIVSLETEGYTLKALEEMRKEEENE